MDLFDEVFANARVTDARHVRVIAGAPWGVSFPSRDVARLIRVTRGTGQLTGTGIETPVQVTGAECFLVQAGATFQLRDAAASALVDCDSLMKDESGTARIGGRGPSTEIVSSRFAIDPLAANALLSSLPALSRVRLDDDAGRLLERTFTLLSQEIDTELLGRGVITSKLSEVLFLQALRCTRPATTGSAGWLGAMSEPRLGVVMRALHAEIARPWTIDDLARRADMSRSAFIDLFKARTGDTPLNYLTTWRMFRARQLLRDTTMSVDQISRAVGYRTGASFSRAFAQRNGRSPSAWRRDHPAEPLRVGE